MAQENIGRGPIGVTCARAMRNEAKRVRALAAVGAVLALSACGGAGPDEATKFAGPWTFDSGQLAAGCLMPLPMPPPLSPKGLNGTLTKGDNATISPQARP